MDTLQFISEFISSISNAAWPIATGIILFTFKDLIISLSNKLVRIKILGNELVMAEAISEGVQTIINQKDITEGLRINLSKYNIDELIVETNNNINNINKLSSKFIDNYEQFYIENNNEDERVLDRLLVKIYQSHKKEWNAYLCEQSQLITEELLRRLGKDKSDLEFSAQSAIYDGNLSGPAPLRKVSQEINRLLNELTRTQDS